MIDNSVYTLETDYTINYTTKYPVPIDEIINSLKHLERILYKTPDFLEKAYAGIQIVDVQIYVSSLQSGSLKEKFLVKFVFKGKENYEKAQEVIEKIMEDSTAVRTIVAIGVGALITYGVMQATSDAPPSKHVEAYNNTIINIGGEVDLKAEDVVAVLKSVKDKKQLAKSAIEIVKPAKNDPGSKIEMSDKVELTIDSDYVRSVPSEYEPPVPDEKEEKYTNVKVLIFASDRDSNEKNWAGSVPDLVDKRVKFILGEDVDPRKLHGRTSVRADIAITSKFNRAKKAYEPKTVELKSVQ